MWIWGSKPDFQEGPWRLHSVCQILQTSSFIDSMKEIVWPLFALRLASRCVLYLYPRWKNFSACQATLMWQVRVSNSLTVGTSFDLQLKEG